VVRWEPPPDDEQNGVITGYKIRYRDRGRGARQAETATSDGNRRLYVLTDLHKDSEYQVRILAQNVNGSGPATPWMRATTYREDLDGEFILKGYNYRQNMKKRGLGQ
jgi:hypothetical protein